MTALERWSTQHDLAAGMPLETLRQQLELPAADLIPPLLEDTGLEVSDGRVRKPGVGLPARVDKAVRTVEEWLADEPFRAPEADELAELKLGPKELAAAVRAGRWAPPRRVAVPLLEQLDARRITRRDDDGTRTLVVAQC
jgi:selenocysteine-specific elongation factor